ncbi:uncharacterized protein LOC143586372 [Bidens hawaiensis]|uniref:uncharacterized protein LOC143586372 n=1 Tax=Bidens hawaiensis TaxID=980011 RepID=UPI00404AFA33
MVSVFSTEYLRSTNTNDITRLLVVAKQRDSPEFSEASIACIGNEKIVTRPGKFLVCMVYNDINVLERSFIFTELAQGCASPVNYTVNGHDYTMGYYLTHGVYPKWRTFVKTIPSPRGNKNKHFAKAQESTRKDVERAFGVLQQRFAIIRGPSRLFKGKDMTYIMKACVILHNMIIEDEQDDVVNLDIEYDQLEDLLELSRNHTIDIMDFIQGHLHIRG